MKVLFFAWLKDEIGVNSYNLELKNSISINELKELLITKLGSKAKILNSTNILCAVNLTLEQDSNRLLNTNDEVAFYPPVTGG